MKRKSGLHKKISSIFDGVPVPGLERKPDQHNEHEMNDHAGQTDPDAPKQNCAFDQANDNENAQSLESKPKAIRKKLKQNQHTAQPENTYVPETHNDSAFPEINQTQNKATQNNETTLPKQANQTKNKKRKTAQSPLRLKLTAIWENLAIKLYGVPADQIDTRQKILTVSIPVLAVIFIIVIWNILGIGQKKPAPVAASQNQPRQIITDAQINWQKPPQLPDAIRDPMKYNYTSTAQTYAAATPATLAISGIVYNQQNPDKSFVIFKNGQMLAAGQTLGGTEIINIEPKQVTFKNQNRTWTQQIAEMGPD